MAKEPPISLAVSGRQAAAMLGISERTLWQFSSPRGPIPCVRLGGRVLYRPMDLERFLEEEAAARRPGISKPHKK